MTNSINELKSYTEYNVNTPTSVFTIGFQYEYNADHVNVYVDGVEATAAGYTVQHDSQGTVTLTPAVPSGVVLLQRETNIDGMVHTFSAGAKFTAGIMDENFKQLRHAQQEVRDETTRTVEQFTTLSTNATAALNAANTAVNTANTIDAKATTALSNSNTAVSTANSANSTANTALSTANGIDAKATTALSDSSTAVSTANSALSTANGIDAKATQAQLDASNALSTVTTQKGAANGIAPLDANAKIEPIYIPFNNTLTSTSVDQALTAAQGKALNDKILGLSQGYSIVTASRVKDTTYTNTTGRPLYLYVQNLSTSAITSVSLSIMINGTTMAFNGGGDAASGAVKAVTAYLVVPINATYSVRSDFTAWIELR